MIFLLLTATALHINKHKKGRMQKKHSIAVVFGAAIKGSGQLFGEILYRTQTAIYLYKQGIVKKIIFSGSDIGYPSIGEASAMRIYARRQGVPENDIYLDLQGHDTAQSIAHSKSIMLRNKELRTHWRSALFISQDYHLARIQMLAQRYGFCGFTYAAHNTRPLVKEKQFFVREIFAYLHNFLWHWP